MARVTLAMANSPMTRAGRLLSSAIGRGTALGSTLNPPRCAAPGVVTLAAACFIGEEVSAFAADVEGGGIEPELDCESVCELGAMMASALSDFDWPCCFSSCVLMAACLAAFLGCGYSPISFAVLRRRVGRSWRRDSTALSSMEFGFSC